ncbi:MAG: hypothetical protein AAFR16_01295, partial [Pseudomonadota bacterium]
MAPRGDEPSKAQEAADKMGEAARQGDVNEAAQQFGEFLTGLSESVHGALDQTREEASKVAEAIESGVAEGFGSAAGDVARVGGEVAEGAAEALAAGVQGLTQIAEGGLKAAGGAITGAAEIHEAYRQGGEGVGEAGQKVIDAEFDAAKSAASGVAKATAGVALEGVEAVVQIGETKVVRGIEGATGVQITPGIPPGVKTAVAAVETLAALAIRLVDLRRAGDRAARRLEPALGDLRQAL